MFDKHNSYRQIITLNLHQTDISQHLGLRRQTTIEVTATFVRVEKAMQKLISVLFSLQVLAPRS